MESHADCRVATPICETTRVEGNAYGPGSNQDAFANFLRYSEFQSHWFTWRFLSSGTFWFKIFPDSVATGFYPDYDWLLWQDNAPGFAARSTTTCRPWPATAVAPPARAAKPASIPAAPHSPCRPDRVTPFCPILNVNAGETYYLLLNNFSTSSTGFTSAWRQRRDGLRHLTSVASATSTTRNNRLTATRARARARVPGAHVRTQGYTYTVLDLLGRTIPHPSPPT